MSDTPTPQRPQDPQDAPPPRATAWPTWVPASGTPDPGLPASALGKPTSGPTPPPYAPSTPPSGLPATEVTYLPAPSGPNWGLVVLGLVFLAAAAGVVANQLAGFEVNRLSDTGPSMLVVGGLVCALVGAVGILSRRRSSP